MITILGLYLVTAMVTGRILGLVCSGEHNPGIHSVPLIYGKAHRSSCPICRQRALTPARLV